MTNTTRKMHKCADGRLVPVITDEEFKIEMAARRLLEKEGWRNKDDFEGKVTIAVAGIFVFLGVMVVCGILRSLTPFHYWRGYYWRWY